MMYKYSCGIMCFDEQDNILLCKRRDTYEYQLIVYGRYKPQKLPALVAFLSPKEKRRLLTCSFEDIWEDIWVDKSHMNYNRDFENAKAKFIEHFETIKMLINMVPSTYRKEYMWGFPKGKPNDKEKFINCALREFQEETRIERKYIRSVTEKPMEVIYKGTDDMWYRSIFWIYKLVKPLPRGMPKSISVKSKIRSHAHSDEVQKLKWIKVSDLSKYLPPNVYAACAVHYRSIFPEIDFGVKILSHPPGL